VPEQIVHEPGRDDGPDGPRGKTAGRVFLGRRGLWLGWRLLLFFGSYAALSVSGEWGIARLDTEAPGPLFLQTALLQEGSGLIAVLLATALMASIEGRTIRSYGYGGSRIGLRALWGIAWGVICASGLVGAMWAGGLLGFDGASLHGPAAWQYGAGWALACGITGIYEESLLRGYLQSTLARGVGFWPAAVALSAAFGLWHLTNDAESVFGLLVAATGGFLFCVSLWYTGSLWWAIGFHAGWDWAQGFLFGLPDSGIALRGTFLNAHPIGNPAWSGGATGPEGSPLMAPVLLLLASGMYLYWGLLRRSASIPRRQERSAR